MAARGLVGSFEEEVTCSVCLDYFTDPVTLECGHNFCRACIGQGWGEAQPDVCCPQCRARAPHANLRPNRLLGNMVELVKQLQQQAGREPAGLPVCERHQEALKLFCQENEAPICVICRESQAHRAHTVVPVEEAAQDYKKRIRSRLERLREQREELQGLKRAWERESDRLLRQTEVERRLVVSECEGLRQLLAEHERVRLARLGELDMEIERRREDNTARLCEEAARLSALITELEGKCQQPAPELLQGARSAVSRGEEVTPLHPAPEFRELEKRLRDFPGEDELQEALTGFLERRAAERGFRRAQGHAVDVTLDPGTAHPRLVLSEDRRCVRLGDTRRDVPNTPRRFDTYPGVLGAEGFTGRRRYWEVDVGDKTGWALGVCRESGRRKGWVTWEPRNGYWVVWLQDGGYKALTSPPTLLSVSVWPRRVGVFLDYEGGEVSFYNVTNGSHLFTFTDSFSGTLRPYFHPGLNARGTNAAPLTLCPVPAQP